MTDMRTPLNKVRGLGSAKEGTDHFWKQRLTAGVDPQRACDARAERDACACEHCGSSKSVDLARSV